MPFRKILIIALLAAGMALAGCAALAPAAPVSTPDPPTVAPATATSMPVSPTATITPTPPPPLSPTPTWVVQGPKQVNVPILLFHHIAVSPIGSRYYVPPDKFEDMIKLLHDWGYQTITTSQLVDAIAKGASLPPRPILITFDDGNADNYTNAFPILKKYGFTGVLYVVVQFMNQPNYLTTDQILEMAKAGWEVGSHSETHRSLIGSPEIQRYEIVQSRQDLQERLGVPILTFAYPFGGEDNAAGDYVHFAGYIAAMGASGFAWQQGNGNLFVLQRCEIKGSDDAKSMTRFLPWLGDPEFLPTNTATATPPPTRTLVPTYTQYPTKAPQASATP
ncbi:MAG TPA: polysaccharide deacetylase family protein [Anaerolineales bacterium]|nr:polysaccharide deacetylase family protein [Anaerolineales bacterium]